MLWKKYRYLWILFFLIVDLISKWMIKEHIPLGESIPVLGNFLKFTFVENRGFVFGLFAHPGEEYIWFKSLFLLFVGIFVMFFVFRLVSKVNHWSNQLGLVLVLSGGIGNLLERFFGNWIYGISWEIPFGAVVDFIDVGIGSHRFYIFNLADSFVSIGVALFLIYDIFLAKKHSSEK